MCRAVAVGRNPNPKSPIQPILHLPTPPRQFHFGCGCGFGGGSLGSLALLSSILTARSQLNSTQADPCRVRYFSFFGLNYRIVNAMALLARLHTLRNVMGRGVFPKVFSVSIFSHIALALVISCRLHFIPRDTNLLCSTQQCARLRTTAILVYVGHLDDLICKCYEIY